MICTPLKVGSRSCLDLEESRSCFEDLERFVSHWAEDPEGFAHFVGWAVGRISPHKFNDLFLAAGASYFSLKEICSRIEFLYQIREREVLKIEDAGTSCVIATVYKRDQVLCIQGPERRIMILRDTLDGLPYYSIRYFIESRRDGEKPTGYLKSHWKNSEKPTFKTVQARLSSSSGPNFEENHMFWNFRKTEDAMRGVIVYPHSEGFFDLQETKRLADLIVQVSNLKNFDRRIA